MQELFNLIGYAIYASMALLAIWGAFNAVLVWRRVAQVRFRNEEEQTEFFDELDVELAKGDNEKAIEICEDDRRAMPQLALYAIENRDLGPIKVQRRLVERFQQDVLADIEHRLAWVSTVTKSAPMVGLFGTVIGMMAAFDNLGQGTKVDPGVMAGNIMVALITTALGLAIAVPLMITTASINIQIRKMEDLIASGLTRLMESLQSITGRA
ncbi:Biopolymer transport protein ExbB [Pirellulimonas nuda]|uniref:Biopolymer transport protein ExbB n=1 Tax=Pirellulimonas nuda TaxID=2528009 RepID=A0A518DB64_9BACT|nr:MotA/TolQ/ExbB proton channel family protein [Pirellulimonas nuda]QDU88725.1 Biopolymer transport protein ExbB [Pirellulimonas nuda]